MLWIGILLFDSELMRTIFDCGLLLSVLGPFGGYWLALIALLLHADNTGDWGAW